MASTIKTNKSELEIASRLPADVEFTSRDIPFKFCKSRFYAIMRRFLCVKREKRSSRVYFFITAENKEKLIQTIKDNPRAKQYDIDGVDGGMVNFMWHKLLGTKQGVNNETN